MAPEDFCRAKAIDFFYDAKMIRSQVTDFVRYGSWDDYVLTRLACSLPKGHDGNHTAYFGHSTDAEELLSWPRERNPLDPFEGV